jgi:hypothetical protein
MCIKLVIEKLIDIMMHGHINIKIHKYGLINSIIFFLTGDILISPETLPLVSACFFRELS